MAEWYPFYPGDFTRDTMHLSCEDVGAYVRLINHYYVTKQPIPDDPHYVRRILGESLQKTRKKLKLLGGFFEKNNGFLYHKKIEFILANQLKRHETAVANGRAGGKAKALANSLATTTTVDNTDVLSTGAKEKNQGKSQENKPPDKPPWHMPNLNIEAIEMYIAYRRESRMKKLKDTSMNLLAKKIIAWSDGDFEIQQQIVEQTISNGWTGLFELKSGGTHEKNQRPCEDAFDAATEDAYQAFATGQPVDDLADIPADAS